MVQILVNFFAFCLLLAALPKLLDGISHALWAWRTERDLRQKEKDKSRFE